MCRHLGVLRLSQKRIEAAFDQIDHTASPFIDGVWDPDERWTDCGISPIVRELICDTAISATGGYTRLSGDIGLQYVTCPMDAHVVIVRSGTDLYYFEFAQYAAGGLGTILKNGTPPMMTEVKGLLLRVAASLEFVRGVDCSTPGCRYQIG